MLLVNLSSKQAPHDFSHGLYVAIEFGLYLIALRFWRLVSEGFWKSSRSSLLIVRTDQIVTYKNKYCQIHGYSSI